MSEQAGSGGGRTGDGIIVVTDVEALVSERRAMEAAGVCALDALRAVKGAPLSDAQRGLVEYALEQMFAAKPVWGGPPRETPSRQVPDTSGRRRGTCGECKFWDGTPPLTQARCCFNAPFPGSGWPLAAASDWCGKFEPRKETL
jgi:hypothetical protein